MRAWVTEKSSRSRTSHERYRCCNANKTASSSSVVPTGDPNAVRTKYTALLLLLYVNCSPIFRFHQQKKQGVMYLGHFHPWVDKSNLKSTNHFFFQGAFGLRLPTAGRNSCGGARICCPRISIFENISRAYQVERRLSLD